MPLKRPNPLFFAITLSCLLIVFAGIAGHWLTTIQLEQIKQRDKLVLATINSADSYFFDKGKPDGFEFQLAWAFADHLGVQLEVQQLANTEQVETALIQRDAQLGAASFNQQPIKQLAASIPYATSQSIAIYRITQGKQPAKDLEQIIGKKIAVIAGSPEEHYLKSQVDKYPELKWTSYSDLTHYQLLERTFNRDIEILLINSRIFDSMGAFFPGLNTAFTLDLKQDYVWLMANKHDDSLQKAVNDFLSAEDTKQLITHLNERFYNGTNPLNFFDTVTFKKNLRDRLPKLQPFFEQAAQESGMNWLFLAAVAYQESHWNPKAVSKTGVKGIMMLTNAAAKEVGVSNRTDPKQSILGGAQYLVNVKRKIPKDISEPDRTLFALAAYNVGFGHLEDARVLTQRSGANPDSWQAVREHLPLLAKKKYYSTVKYGYARGYEPVQYVKNIQEYLKLLEWEQQQADIRQEKQQEAQQVVTEPEDQPEEKAQPEKPPATL